MIRVSSSVAMVPTAVPAQQFTLTHELFLLDANLRTPLDYRRREEITANLVNELMKELEMAPLSPLQIYPASDPRAPGWSFIQLITTSHITGHYFEASETFSHIHMDIYSCKSYDWRKALQIIDQHLDILDWKGNFILRSANLRGRKTEKMSGYNSKVFGAQEKKLNTQKVLA